MKIAVIGGGASGMMAAITAASKGAEVCLYEGNDRVGKKLLSTGNGRCNFSNRRLTADNYYSQDKERIQNVLAQFDTDAAISFFEKAGMLIKDRDGYLYPASGQASTVLDILRMQLKEKKVQLLTDSKVKGLKRDNNGQIAVETATGKGVFDRVILACGSKAAPKTGSDGSGYRLAQSMGHTLVPIVPALVQLKCRE
ncbi:MAG: aminoacetone oxidase family FAD-binding enzyme, partial [Lachnospiraceae bacterium]